MPLYRVRTVLTGYPGAPYLNTMWFNTFGGATAQAAVTAVGAFWTAMDANMGTPVSWVTEPDVATISEITGGITAVTQTTASSGTGNGGTGVVPNAAQGLIRLRTGVVVGARELRGRIFVPALVASPVSGDVPSTIVAAMNVNVANLIADLNSELVVYSRAHAGFASVVAATAWTEFASLRSRRD